MRIQMLCGGLGSQIWHYSFVRFAERSNPEEKWLFDDSYFYTYDHVSMNFYRMEDVFGLKLNLLSNHYDECEWQEIIRLRKTGLSMPQILFDRGIPLVMVEGCPEDTREPFSGAIVEARKNGKLGFDPALVKLPYENIYYHADWARKDYFMAFREENKAEMPFPKLTSAQNMECAEKIKNSRSVGIHVRRGDFIWLGRDLGAGKYRDACKNVVERYPDAHFFVFSDDLEWCKANADAAGFNLANHTTFIYGNSDKKKNYIDMQLLSMCRGMIRNAESSFSQVAGWFNDNLEFEIKIKSDHESIRNDIKAENQPRTDLYWRWLHAGPL